MTPPPPAGTATARKVNTAAQPRRESAPGRRAPLRVIPREDQGSRRGRRVGPLRRLRASNHFLTMMSLSLVVGALLVVVVGQAMLADGQVRMQSAQNSLANEQIIHRQNEFDISQLETPDRIVSAANALGMVAPSSVTELPYVSLNTPLPTPMVTPAVPAAPAAPPATTPTTTPPSTTATTSSTSSTATSQ